MIKMPKNAEKKIRDYKLTRYACYLIAQKKSLKQLEKENKKNLIKVEK